MYFDEEKYLNKLRLDKIKGLTEYLLLCDSNLRNNIISFLEKMTVWIKVDYNGEMDFIFVDFQNEINILQRYDFLERNVANGEISIKIEPHVILNLIKEFKEIDSNDENKINFKIDDEKIAMSEEEIVSFLTSLTNELMNDEFRTNFKNELEIIEDLRLKTAILSGQVSEMKKELFEKKITDLIVEFSQLPLHGMIIKAALIGSKFLIENVKKIGKSDI